MRRKFFKFDCFLQNSFMFSSFQHILDHFRHSDVIGHFKRFISLKINIFVDTYQLSNMALLCLSVFKILAFSTVMIEIFFGIFLILRKQYLISQQV